MVVQEQLSALADPGSRSTDVSDSESKTADETGSTGESMEGIQSDSNFEAVEETTLPIDEILLANAQVDVPAADFAYQSSPRALWLFKPLPPSLTAFEDAEQGERVAAIGVYWCLAVGTFALGLPSTTPDPRHAWCVVHMTSGRAWTLERCIGAHAQRGARLSDQQPPGTEGLLKADIGLQELLAVAREEGVHGIDPALANCQHFARRILRLAGGDFELQDFAQFLREGLAAPCVEAGAAVTRPFGLGTARAFARAGVNVTSVMTGAVTGGVTGAVTGGVKRAVTGAVYGTVSGAISGAVSGARTCSRALT